MSPAPQSFKKVLIVSPHFPPINAPDMQRVRMSLPYYRRFGWEPVVLTVDERCQDGALEPELLATIPGDLRVVRVRAAPAEWTRRIGIGALGLRAWPYLLRRGARLLRREKFDLVFFSTSQFITYTLGRLWKARYGVPYLIDVQDPWRSDYYDKPGAPPPPGGWKYQFARLQAWALEGWCFAGSAAVLSVSPRLLQDLLARYPGLAIKPSAVLGFGASPIDLEKALALPGMPAGFSRENGEVHLLATGAAGAIMEPALTALFEALASYRRRAPQPAGRLRLHFIGTSYAPGDRGRPSVMPVAARHGVADLIEEAPRRVGFLRALRLQQEADALLLLGSNDPAYSPSKVYFYYLAGRPILAVVFKGSVLERLLDELAGATMVRLSTDQPRPGPEETLHRFFDRLLSGEPTEGDSGRNDAYFRAHYLAENLTGRQCALFESALAAGSPRARP